jgi:hypothetical protein
MSMQHFLIPFCAFFCLCRVAAQTSIGFETGFGGRWAADNTLGATVRSTEDFYESSIKARSLGQGSLFGIQISHALNSAFALELGISYFYGTPQRRHLYTPEPTAEISSRATLFRLTPSLKWTVAGQEHFQYFCRVGGGIGVGSRKGYAKKMIAAELDISINTVKTHLKRVYEKMQVRSAPEAVAKAIRERWV